ncbi:FG-GAP repeat domain-containing protein [Acidobacteriota bacterium]
MSCPRLGYSVFLITLTAALPVFAQDLSSSSMAWEFTNVCDYLITITIHNSGPQALHDLEVTSSSPDIEVLNICDGGYGFFTEAFWDPGGTPELRAIGAGEEVSLQFLYYTYSSNYPEITTTLTPSDAPPHEMAILVDEIIFCDPAVLDWSTLSIDDLNGPPLKPGDRIRVDLTIGGSMVFCPYEPLYIEVPYTGLIDVVAGDNGVVETWAITWDGSIRITWFEATVAPDYPRNHPLCLRGLIFGECPVWGSWVEFTDDVLTSYLGECNDEYYDDATCVIVGPLPAVLAPLCMERAGSVPDLHASLPGQLADIDGDGDLDLLEAPDDLWVYRYDSAGDLTFANTYSTQLDTGIGANGFALSDFNGDEYPDVAVVRVNMTPPPGGLSVLSNRGNGTFLAPALYPISSTNTFQPAVFAAEVDGSPGTDIIVIFDEDSMIEVFPNLGDGTFGPSVVSTISTGLTGMFGVQDDFNQDGHADVVLPRSGAGGFETYLGDGAGGFSTPILTPTAGSAGMLVSGDLNNNGIPDMAAAQVSLEIFVGLGDGSFTWTESHGLRDPPVMDLAIAHLACSESPDIIVAGAYGLEVFGSAEARGFDLENHTISWFAVGDIDGDGPPDLIVKHSTTSRWNNWNNRILRNCGVTSTLLRDDSIRSLDPGTYDLQAILPLQDPGDFYLGPISSGAKEPDRNVLDPSRPFIFYSLSSDFHVLYMTKDRTTIEIRF